MLWLDPFSEFQKILASHCSSTCQRHAGLPLRSAYGRRCVDHTNCGNYGGAVTLQSLEGDYFITSMALGMLLK